MKRYFVITKHSADNSHFNEQDLLPASCKLITGIAVNVTVKQESELDDDSQDLIFPQNLISDLLLSEGITSLFYSYLRTRATMAESKDFFESDILPEIVTILSQNLKYTCLSEAEQASLNGSIAELFNTQFADYLYNESDIYEKGKSLSNLEFADLIAQRTMMFAYLHKSDVFIRPLKVYKRPEPYECGNISLLVNGNSFLLRDYMVTANRKVRNMSKEIIPFHEPLEVNSNLHAVFKSNKNSGDNTLTIRIYIEYEHERVTA
nr:hypothetical protein [uncultured Carboxylicivirga sp.]